MVERKKGRQVSNYREMGDLVVFWVCFTVRREREIGRSLMAGRGEGWATVRRERGGNKGRKGKKALEINFE